MMKSFGIAGKISAPAVMTVQTEMELPCNEDKQALRKRDDYVVLISKLEESVDITEIKRILRIFVIQI